MANLGACLILDLAAGWLAPAGAGRWLEGRPCPWGPRLPNSKGGGREVHENSCAGRRKDKPWPRVPEFPNSESKRCEIHMRPHACAGAGVLPTLCHLSPEILELQGTACPYNAPTTVSVYFAPSDFGAQKILAPKDKACFYSGRLPLTLTMRRPLVQLLPAPPH